MLLRLIKHQRPNTDKIYLYIKDAFEWKYILLINIRELTVGIKESTNPKSFIDYSQANDEVYKNLENYNPAKKREVLIVFYNMIAEMEANEKLGPIITEWFLIGRKPNVFLAFISQSYFKVCQTISLNATHYNQSIKNT